MSVYAPVVGTVIYDAEPTGVLYVKNKILTGMIAAVHADNVDTYVRAVRTLYISRRFSDQYLLAMPSCWTARQRPLSTKQQLVQFSLIHLLHTNCTCFAIVKAGGHLYYCIFC
jgi:hypothetical protein